MIEAILIISVLNLALQVLAAWQRHETLKNSKREREGG